MKRVVRPAEEPDLLQGFRAVNPQGTWKSKPGSDQLAFKNEPGSEVVYEALAASQGHICAYCEIEIERGLKGQVEHFVPECLSNGDHNFAIDFPNMLACCEGGTRCDIENGRWEPPLPQTIHCGQLKGDMDPRGVILDPVALHHSPCLWVVKSDGALEPCPTSCAAAGVPVELAAATVDALGLDRKGLRRMRKVILEDLEFDLLQLVEEEGLDEDLATRQIASEQLLPSARGQLAGFWSTIRHWAGDAAERLLRKHAESIPGMASP